MKVAIFSRFPIDPSKPRGGVEAVTVALAPALAALEQTEVHVLTLERGRERAASETHQRATIHRLPASRWPMMADMLFGPGRRAIMAKLRELMPDVVHTHEAFGRALPASLPYPQVATVHGFESENINTDRKRGGWFRGPLWLRIEKAGWARQTQIISIAPYVREKLQAHTTAQIHDIENPVEARFFDVPRQEEIGRIICVGWVTERKNTVGSIEAFARIAADFPQARLVIAGARRDPAYSARVDDAIRRHQLAGRIDDLGHVNREQLMRELGRASILLLPSFQENAPMAIEEAMAVGVPVVASNRCGMPTMIAAGVNGFLIEPDEPDDIAGRLSALLGDNSLRTKMGAAARSSALERFHPHAIARRTRTVYETAIREFESSRGAARATLTATR